jgi:hypothetical protein
MTANLCKDNEQYWKEAEESVILSLKKRIELWNGVYRELTERKTASKINYIELASR